jgi:hypothetical protein
VDAGFSPDRFASAMRLIDEANARDPQHPKEFLYSEQMTAWLERLAPDAPEALRLAARCQHIRRWEIPRTDFPEGRHGYLRWRTRLYGFHAECAAEILRQAGYDEPTVARVGELLRKQGLTTDPEMQLLEDVACLVFLESYFADFARKHDEGKMIEIVRKTWGKMSERARELALGLPLAAEDRALIEKALTGPLSR